MSWLDALVRGLRGEAAPAAARPAEGWTTEGAHDRDLGQASVRFAGFTPKRIDRNLRKFDNGVREAPPLLEFADAQFMPLRRCLYRADGARIDETRWTYADPDAPVWESLEAKAADREDRLTPETMRIPGEKRFTRIKDPVLFLGDAKKHYGHFVTDGLARAWALEAIDAGAKVFFAQDPGPAFERPYVRAVWEALGVGPDRVIAPDTPLAFDRLLCPIPAIQLSRRNLSRVRRSPPASGGRDPGRTPQGRADPSTCRDGAWARRTGRSPARLRWSRGWRRRATASSGPRPCPWPSR